MTSCRARRMSERRLESEDIDPPLYRVRGMAVPQLVWVNVKTGGSSPLSANISNRLSSEMSLATGARKYIAVSFAAAKRLKKLERVTGHSNSPCFGSFSKQVDLTAIGENFDVLPFDNCDLRNSATQQIRTPDKGVIALGVAVEMNSSGDGCHQQPELLFAERPGALAGHQHRARWHRVPGDTSHW